MHLTIALMSPGQGPGHDEAVGGSPHVGLYGRFTVEWEAPSKNKGHEAVSMALFYQDLPWCFAS